MAEYVQQNIEDMLPELEQLERVGLFTKDETRQILNKRQGYEYRLRRQTKCKEDFLQYIQYEINCLALLRKRREKTGYSFKQLNIENVIKERIHKLFRMVTYRFQDDIKLWLSHVAFCESNDDVVRVGKIFTRMLQVHNKKPEIWVLSAKWEFENKNPQIARASFQRGLRFNPDSKQLWLEYYRMELLYTDKLLKRKKILGIEDPEIEGDKDVVLSGKVAMVVYNRAKEVFKDDVELILLFNKICQLFSFTKYQQDQMFHDLKTNHADNPLTWDARARQCQVNGKDMEKEEKMHSIYEKAISRINTSEMWGLYIKRCIELVKEKTENSSKKKRLQKVINVFGDALEQQVLTEDLYLQWIEILLNVGLIEKAEEAVKFGVKQYPGNIKLWEQRLLISIETGKSEDDVMQIFKNSKKKVVERESWSLWKILLDFLSSNKSDLLLKILEEGSTRYREVSIPVKEFYLNWIGLTSGIQDVRHLYHKLQQLQPLSLDFYKTYLSIELSQVVPKVKLIRQGYEDTVTEFGEINSDLWLDYIRFESTRGKPEHAGILYYRAIKNLKGDMNSEFITKHTLIQAGHVIYDES